MRGAVVVVWWRVVVEGIVLDMVAVVVHLAAVDGDEYGSEYCGNNCIFPIYTIPPLTITV